MHFSSRGTGFSTLRRSIGALLKDELTLEAIPRSSGKAQSNYQNYRFRAEGEEKLTSWMAANLEVGVCPVDSEYRPVEKQLIAELQPVLCLTGWPNPHARQIKESRRKCADEARSR